MPVSVYQKLMSADPANENETAVWSDRGSADGTEIGGALCYVRLNVVGDKSKLFDWIRPADLSVLKTKCFIIVLKIQMSRVLYTASACARRTVNYGDLF